MVESPNHQRARLSEEPDSSPGSRPGRGKSRRRTVTRGPGCEPLEGRELLTANAWRTWGSPTAAPPTAEWKGWSATVEPRGVTDQAVATTLSALDDGITAAQNKPNASTDERLAVREGLLAVRALAHQAADEPPAASNSSSAEPMSVAEQVARLKSDIQALAKGRSLPDPTVAERLVTRLDAVVQELRFTPDDLGVSRITPAPAPASSGAPTPGIPTTIPVTVTTPGALPSAPIFPSWRTFAPRPS